MQHHIGLRVHAPSALAGEQLGIYPGAGRAVPLVMAGVVMFVLYIGMDVVASLAYDGYSYRDQTISELSAIGAPTRALWLSMSVVYQILGFAFAIGVLQMAGRDRRLRVAGLVLLALATTGLTWWVAPMHMREVLAADGGTWQDTLHLALGGATTVLYLSLVSVGALSLGRGFRLYSFVTIATLLSFGALMSSQTAGVGNNEATPWLGVWERIAVEGSMLWQAVFAVGLVRRLRS